MLKLQILDVVTVLNINIRKQQQQQNIFNSLLRAFF